MSQKQLVPFPDIPLPTRFKRIKTDPQSESKADPVPNIAHVESEAPAQEPELEAYTSIVPTDFPELKIGGELEPESPKIINKGDHVIEEVDYSDYL